MGWLFYVWKSWRVVYSENVDLVVFGVTSLVNNGENSTERSLNIEVSMANATKANEHD